MILSEISAHRAVLGAETLHIEYEQLRAAPLDTLRTVFDFIGGDASMVDESIFEKAKMPLKNTPSNLNNAVENLLEIAAVARKYAYLRPYIPKELVEKLDHEKQQVSEEFGRLFLCVVCLSQSDSVATGKECNVNSQN